MNRRKFCKLLLGLPFLGNEMLAGNWSFVDKSDTADVIGIKTFNNTGITDVASKSYCDDGSELLRLYISKSRGDKKVNVDKWDYDTLNYVLRDYHTGSVRDMDTDLIDLLSKIQEKVGTRRRIEVLSAYRTKRTNERLRKRLSGVAKHSYHIEGKAVDIRVMGVSTKKLQRIARKLQAGGVGYYPRHGFVHVDVGPVRQWRG